MVRSSFGLASEFEMICCQHIYFVQRKNNVFYTHTLTSSTYF